MKRREFMFLLAGTIVFPPNLLRAQQSGRIFKIGHLEFSTPSNSPHLLGAFRDRLRELGYVDGQNLFIERRYAEGKEERLPQLAAELVKYGVDVIFALGFRKHSPLQRRRTRFQSFSLAAAIPLRLGWSKALVTRVATSRE